MKKRNKKFRKINVLIVLCALIAIVSVGVFSFARYISNIIWNNYLESQDFYFYSEQLDGTVNLNNQWNGGAVYFELTNFNEANEVSKHEINYEITCEILDNTSGNLSCDVNNNNSSSYTGVLQKVEICTNETSDGVDTSTLDEETCNNRGYTWIKGHTSVNQFFTVKSSDPNEEIDNVKVKVVAESTDPYSKTLTGEFELKKGKSDLDDLIVQHESYSDYEKLIITNNTNNLKEFFLKWDPTRLQIAKGDYQIQSVTLEGLINEIDIKVAKGETVTYTFYKSHASDTITVDDFILLEKPLEAKLAITSIELLHETGGVTEMSSPTFTDDTTRLHVNLPSSSSTFKFQVTVANTTEETYMFKRDDILINTSGIDYVTNGLSLYQEIPPGKSSIFTIEYLGGNSLTSNELVLELQYIFEQGEVYKDETLNGAVPEIIDGLIPIIYNESTKNWEKADVINGRWYDYSTLKWANATSVVASKKDYYVDADPGTVVEMSDMTSMMVWIPRYSYTLRDDNGYHGYGADPLSRATPGAFDIKFVSSDTTDNGTGTYNGAYPSNYYTSPAFCWGNTCDDPATRNDPENVETKGFWIAKFEASTSSNLVYSKPNVKPAASLTIAQTFYQIQNLMNGANGYNNYGFVGFVDAHLIKNTEWGAIAYLSQSKYGKYGNTEYTGLNKEVYPNNCESYITGIGGDGPQAQRTTTTCYTNTYDTYNGMGASTTGNIYGVYDMVGGTFDRVMGTVLSSNGTFLPDQSGFTSMPEGRYINVYPAADYGSGQTPSIKGDAVTETISFYNDRFVSGDHYAHTWFYRGGSLWSTDTEINGVFSYTTFSGQADLHHSSRYTITMYGSLVNDI